MSTHNLCFYIELEKIIPELSSNTPAIYHLRPLKLPLHPLSCGKLVFKQIILIGQVRVRVDVSCITTCNINHSYHNDDADLVFYIPFNII